MSISENNKGCLGIIGSFVAMFAVVGFLAFSCDAKNESMREFYRQQEIENQKKKDLIWKKHYIDFMTDCGKVQKLPICCQNDFKNSYLKENEPRPEFCKTTEERLEKAARQSEENTRPSGRSFGDHVKQGVGVGIGLKVINSIL